MKTFQVEGTCNPDRHYMVDTKEKINTIVETLIEKNKYFTINRARQYGKTTTLSLLEKTLRERYLVLRLSFEAADEYFASLYHFSMGFVMDVARELRRNGAEAELISEWEKPVSKDFPLKELGNRITYLCLKSQRELILLIDEVDKSSDNQIFLAFLGLLRNKYLEQIDGRDHTFKSVILAGVYDIKNLKLKLHHGEEQKYNSPWNVAADFNIDMSFSPAEIVTMLSDYDKEHHSGMDTYEMSQLLYDYTSGYPSLVSRLCKLIDEVVSQDLAFSETSVWTKEGFLAAVKILLKEKNTLFDDMVKQLSENADLKQVLQNILFRGSRYSYEVDNSVLNIGIMFGFLKESQNTVVISNRIFETKLYNLFISEEEVSSMMYNTAVMEKNQFVENGVLQMDIVIRKFQEHFVDIYADSTDKFIEENGRRIFLMYLKPIINGVGNYYIEARTRDMKRTDVIVDYCGKQYVVEMKIWHGAEYNKRGEKQISEYLEYYHLDKGYMVSFNFNKKKQTGVKEIVIEGKTLVEAVV